MSGTLDPQLAAAASCHAPQLRNPVVAHPTRTRAETGQRERKSIVKIGNGIAVEVWTAPVAEDLGEKMIFPDLTPCCARADVRKYPAFFSKVLRDCWFGKDGGS